MSQRLRSSSDIRAVFGARSVAHAAALSVHVLRRTDTESARATVVAGRRVGGAVLRNRAKRRIRAALADCPLPGGLDVVIVARAASAHVPFTNLVEQLRASLERTMRTGAAT